jgi:adenylate cyclase
MPSSSGSSLCRCWPAAAAVAGVGIPYDEDSVLRRALLVNDGRPSLALAIASRARGFVAPPDLELSASHLFRYNGPSRQGITTVSYYQALDAAGSLPRGIFANKDVVIGRSLEVVSIDTNIDHFRTPVAARMSGAEVHATIVDALYRQRFIADPFATLPAAIVLCAVAALVAAGGLFFVSPPVGGVLVVAVSAGLLLAGYAAFLGGVHVPVAGPSLAIAVTFAVAGGYRVALATRERRLIKRAFQHYVAPAIVEQMLNDPSKLKLGGELYEITVLFTDLAGFTTLTERLTPAQLSRQLGEYFTEMLDVLLPQHGTLDKLIGDSIMMYFGCPLPDRDHALHACRGALAMQRRMVSLNERWSSQNLPLLRTRIGINTGVAVGGNMGTTTIFNYTVLGDCVNLASRLEGVNKEYGTLIIVGEDTWRLVHEAFEGRELDWIRVKGRTAPVAIYELAGERGEIDAQRRELFQQFAEGLLLYRAQRWADAAQAFRRALELDPNDGPSQTLLKRSTMYDQHAPDAWDGVHAMAPG